MRFHLGRSVTRSTEPTGPSGELDDGTALAADVVVEAGGLRSHVEWLAGNGLDLANGVACDEHSTRCATASRSSTSAGAGRRRGRFPVPGFGTVRNRALELAYRDRRARGAEPAAGIAGTPSRRLRSSRCRRLDQPVGRPVPVVGDAAPRPDRCPVLEGDIPADAASGYHDETSRLVGVVLIGLTRELLTYRPASQPNAAHTAADGIDGALIPT